MSFPSLDWLPLLFGGNIGGVGLLNGKDGGWRPPGGKQVW